MKAYRWLLVLLAFLVVIGGARLVSKTPAPQPTPSVVEKIGIATITITAGPQDSKTFESVAFTNGETALEFTRKVAQVETTGEGETAFVTAINGIVASETNRQFWSFGINGQDAPVGAGAYKVKDSDIISWKLATF